MSNTFINKIHLTTYDFDASLRLKISSVLKLMSITANEHCLEADSQNADLRNYGMFWVLLRAHVKINEQPSAGNEIIIKTGSKMEGSRIFHRYFLFETSDGKQIGYATTVWLVLNEKTRQITRLPENSKILEFLKNNNNYPSFPELKPIKCDYPVFKTQIRTVMYSDLDENNHMNNTRYAEWICDVIGYDKIKKLPIKDFKINYIKEAPYSTAIKLELSARDNSYCVRGFNNADNILLFISTITF